jgi:glycosyltransferase involved in cell wall biosynthesis
MGPPPLVSVVIPALDAEATIANTLAGLGAQDLDGPFEVIVVDDGSTDSTRRIATQAQGAVRVLDSPRLGPGPARNLGAAEARAPVLAFLDADCTPRPGWLRAGLAAIEAADLVQGRVEADPADLPGPFDHMIWVLGPSALYESANLFVRSDLFRRLGGFEDWLRARIGKPLGEDVWFGWRARRAGARTAYAGGAVVAHAAISRGPRGFVAERRRLAYFPAMTRQIPELRDEFFFARIFLNRRSARFDLALAGLGGALATRSPKPLAAAVPYVAEVLRGAAPQRRNAALVAAATVAADAVGFVSLVAGSVRWRRLVL